jgi:hypothetical protein
MAKYRIDPSCIGMLLSGVKSEKIKIDQAVQRSFCSSSEFINNLVSSAVSNDVYIPNIILAEETSGNKIKITYVVDGGQRITSLRKFMYENYKITKTIRNPIIKYTKKKMDENGDIVRDDEGNIVWEETEFDLRGKTYMDLPEELKESFFNCPISVTVYQGCKSNEVSGLVNLYNNHVSMNVSQKSLTYLGNFAETTKKIKDTNTFLINGTALSQSEKQKGIWERTISECVMAINHFEDWKKDPKKMCDFLNDNSSEEEYEQVNDYFNRLAPYSDRVESKEVSELFVFKDIPVWMKVFDNFTKFNVSDDKFGEFLKAFISDLKDKEIDGVTWDDLDMDKHTKDKSVIQKKVEYLTYLLMEFLHIDSDENAEEKTENVEVETKTNEECVFEETDLEFVQEMISPNITEEDLKGYEEDLDVYTLDVDNNTLLLNRENKRSLLAIIAYAYKNDITLDDWFVDFFNRNKSYLFDQKENFNMMKKDLDDFIMKGSEDA